MTAEHSDACGVSHWRPTTCHGCRVQQAVGLYPEPIPRQKKEQLNG